MDISYIDHKVKEILTFMNTDMALDINHKKKFLRLILESIYLCGKVNGVQSAREVLND